MSNKISFYLCNATPVDFISIRSIMQPDRAKYFGSSKHKFVDSRHFFKYYCTHRILIKESKTSRDILGYAEIHNYPHIHALPKDCWMDWLKHHYCLQLPVSTSNILFFNYFLYLPTYAPHIMKKVLSELFYRENEVRYIITVEMPDQDYSYREPPDYELPFLYGKTYYPRVYNITHSKNVQRLHVFARDNIVPKMRYRLALPEDNDDIVEIIDHDRPDLRHNLGDYYIAEKLLNDEDTHNKFIVTEVNNLTSGFIWLNDHVDILKIIKNYDCHIFGTLVKFSQFDQFKDKVIRVASYERRPMPMLFTADAIDNMLGKYTKRDTLPDSIRQSRPITEFQRQLVSSQERFSIVDRYFKQMQEISDKLKSSEYYFDVREKLIRLYYNVSPEENTDEPEIAFSKASNVFALQLFGLHDKHDVRRIFRFLATSFNAYPDRDYCIFSMPQTAEMTKILFELLKYFYLIPPRPGCTINDRVFITHRSTIYGEISVHNVRPSDVSQIEHLMASNRNTFNTRSTEASIMSELFQERPNHEAELVRHVLNEVFTDPYSKYNFLTLRCGNAANSIDDNVFVGFVVLRSLTKLYELQQHFLLPEESKFGTAEVLILRLHPFYHFKSDMVFREMARNTDFYVFYYLAPTKSCVKPLPNDLAINMQPIEPRRIKKSDLLIESNEPPSENLLDHLDYKTNSFEVFHQNLKPSKFFGNRSNQIVIIGFSHLCMAFLRQLLFSWNSVDLKNSGMFCCLPRLQVTVIVAPGVVEAEYDGDFKCLKCKNQTECWVNQDNCNEYISDCIRRMDFRKYVKFMSGSVLRIDRETKHVVLTNNCEIYYDTLLFLNARKFGSPKQINAPYELPPNYAHFNNRLDKMVFYYKLMLLLQENLMPHIVVYGLNLQTFEFINFLVVHGVHGSSITLITPYDLAKQRQHTTLNNPFADHKIEVILLEMVADMGVKVNEQFNFSNWSHFQNIDGLANVTFEYFNNEAILLEVECDFFVSFKEIHMDSRTVDVLSAANIDLRPKRNKIYVNERFQTNDPFIYASGNFIKHRVKPNHQYKWVNIEENAQKLLVILNLKESEQPDKFDVKFRKPAFFQADLPMKHHIIKVTLPKRYLANHLTNEYLYSMSTYKNETFTRIRLNQHFVVEQILCVTTMKMSFDFLQNLCGKHESMLNNLIGRWYSGELDNFIGFFLEPWTQLLMHDSYEELHEFVKCVATQPIEETLDMEMERHQRRQYFTRHAHEVGLSKLMEEGFLRFVRKYRRDFKYPLALPEDFPKSGDHFK